MSDKDLRIEAPKKRKSGIPAGNAGEYFVMGELLRRGFDAQLADRNTQGYDLLVGRIDEPSLHKVQIKTVRSAPWYVKLSDFKGQTLEQVTIYVLLGSEQALKPIRFFIVVNRDVAEYVHHPPGWSNSAFMPLNAIKPFENHWDTLNKLSIPGVCEDFD